MEDHSLYSAANDVQTVEMEILNPPANLPRNGEKKTVEAYADAWHIPEIRS